MRGRPEAANALVQLQSARDVTIRDSRSLTKTGALVETAGDCAGLVLSNNIPGK